MIKRILYQFIINSLILFSISYSQAVYNMNEVAVTASRIHPEYRNLLRSVTVIDSSIIESIPSNSIGDILNYQAGVDVQQRGYHGIQGDASISGSSFEQVLVLIDGIRLNDSQTAHHSLDLPVNLTDIERIEIMQGHGSSIYGTAAFGGVINIITKSVGKSPFKISASAGDFRLLNYEIHKSFRMKNIKSFITLNNKKSSGYRFDTDFDRFTLYSKSQIDSKYSKLFLSIGYLDNDFGANSFYGQSPSKEHTKILLTSLTGEFNRFKNVIIESKIFLRRHKDLFLYDIGEPEKYLNNHKKYRIGGELIAKIALSSKQKVIIGTELINENIKSTELGTHDIKRAAVFTEYGNTFKDKILVNLGIRGDYRSNYSLGWYPTFSAGYRFSRKFKFRTSVGKCFRTPSFTELYYWDPTNSGNPDLKPEKGWSYEMGFDFFSGNIFLFQSNIFMRKHSEIIDWISEDFGKHWQAENIGKLYIKGSENVLKISLDNDKIIYLKYAYTSSDFKKGYNYFSKYVFRYPVHQFTLEANCRLPFDISNYLTLTIKKRREEKNYVVLNANFFKMIDKTLFFVKIMNILNERYQEIFGVPAPGRWFETGIKLEM